MDEIDIDKLKTVEKIKKEIQRFQKFNYIMMGSDNNDLPKKISEINIKNYAKYILLEGTKQEKRDLLECLKSKLILKDKVLRLEEWFIFFIKLLTINKTTRTLILFYSNKHSHILIIFINKIIDFKSFQFAFFFGINWFFWQLCK